MQILGGGDTAVPVSAVNKSMTCEEYRSALLKFANQEIAAAVSCVRQGLLKVVPAAALFSLSWRQLQTNVCGSSSLKFDDLEPFLTTQPGAAISDAAFSMLKNVLRSFTPQELSMFLRFCTGLLRLPVDAKSRKGFNINLRPVIPSSGRQGRAAAANPDGFARTAADALIDYHLTSSSAVDCPTRKHAFGLWNGHRTLVKLCARPLHNPPMKCPSFSLGF
jgi:hypothetical protein